MRSETINSSSSGGGEDDTAWLSSKEQQCGSTRSMVRTILDNKFMSESTYGPILTLVQNDSTIMSPSTAEAAFQDTSPSNFCTRATDDFCAINKNSQRRYSKRTATVPGLVPIAGPASPLNSVPLMLNRPQPVHLMSLRLPSPPAARFWQHCGKRHRHVHNSCRSRCATGGACSLV